LLELRSIAAVFELCADPDSELGAIAALGSVAAAEPPEV